MKNVIVVPETDEYKLHVSHENVVWINSTLGTPKLKQRNVNYLVPFWKTEGFKGVNRIFHIESSEKLSDGTTKITLGNSFVVNESLPLFPRCAWERG